MSLQCAVRSRPRRGWLPFLALAIVTVFAVQGCDRAERQPQPLTLIKLDAAGERLEDAVHDAVHDVEHVAEREAVAHHCVLDAATGLVWSVEQPEPGLLYHGHTYSWFSSSALAHMSEPGTPGGGDCPLARCDTEALLAAVNASELCGRSDWRLPLREEALAIGDPSRVGRGATLSPIYFPAAVADEYWTGTTFPMYPQGAWVYDARHGHDRVDWKSSPKRVRLVAGRPGT